MCCVHSFESTSDQEAVGLLASSLAYGRVETIVSNIGKVLDKMDDSPSHYINSTSYEKKKKHLTTFKHRFNTGDDIALLLECIKRINESYGSIQLLFRECFHAGDGTIKFGLSEFIRSLHTIALQIDTGFNKSFEFLLSSPENGSACKRMAMYLRWMIRPADGIDLGLWTTIPVSALIIPVDTHIASIATSIGLSRRRNADWKMAEEITDSLRKIDPIDPVRFDFSLCRLGMVSQRKVQI